MDSVNETMSGKVCMVTGATSGIGKETARELVRMGARVVIVSSSQVRCAAVVEEFRKESRNQKVDYLVADLSSQAEIHRLASDFQRRYDRLDVLVNNAGGFFMRRQLSVDGIEMTLALNHLNYFLLTSLLLDMLRSSAPARIVNVSSNAHRGAKIDFDDLQGEHSYSGWRAYAQSKLANVLHAYELARHMDVAEVTVNVLHPGFVSTRLARNNGWLFRLVMPLMRIIARSPEDGARTSVYLASSPEVEGVTGKYFEDEQVVPADPAARDEATARKLWQICEKMAGLVG
jgi:NAD(P)-dependent dehydrogenase (short-subunit alcohol dehydrogenase family)